MRLPTDSIDFDKLSEISLRGEFGDIGIKDNLGEDLARMERTYNEARRLCESNPGGELSSILTRELVLLGTLADDNNVSFPNCVSVSGMKYGSYGNKAGSIKSEIQRVAGLNFDAAWFEDQVQQFRDYLTKTVTSVRQAIELYKKAHQTILQQ